MGGTTVSRGRRSNTRRTNICVPRSVYIRLQGGSSTTQGQENTFHQIKTYVSVLKQSRESSMKHNDTFDWGSSGAKAIFSLTIDRPRRFRDPRRRPACRPPLTDANTINVVLKNRSGKKEKKLIRSLRSCNRPALAQF